MRHEEILDVNKVRHDSVHHAFERTTFEFGDDNVSSPGMILVKTAALNILYTEVDGKR